MVHAGVELPSAKVITQVSLCSVGSELIFPSAPLKTIILLFATSIAARCE